ncbi:MAG: glucose-1-phosphate adenylyltransferase [Acholeplasmatales bacterium]|jgi:glucose-1-phosphate adenylyltransferase|nr:glucose-1-phosphate adenylyltransferase [Acholeplasmatales bacterium]
METLALILAGGKGTRLDILSEKRSKPAMPFAGKYRIIDFCLSNCVQSNIYDIAILTQYLPFSLNEHIGAGKPWDLDRRDSSCILLQPHSNWYNGTADAVLKNLEFVERRNPKYVLILSGDHIYKMDYRKMIEVHKKMNASLTIAVQQVDIKEASRFGILNTNSEGYVTSFDEKPKVPKSNLASMGIYIFDFEVLDKILKTVKNDNLDFGHHIIPYMVENSSDFKVATYLFNDYWQDVGTYESYLDTNLALTKDEIVLDLYDPNWRIFTKSEELPPVKIGAGAKITNSLISNGCIVYGTVINSVLSPGVRVGKGTIIENSVVLNNTIIHKNCKISKSILDKKCIVGEGSQIGYGDDTKNIEKPDLLESGISVLEKGTIVPPSTQIGKNCRIFQSAKFENKLVKSGETLR